MKTKVTVLRSEGRAYKDPKSGRVSKSVTCQCIVHQLQEDGTILPDVGVLRVNEALCPVRATSTDLDDLPDVPAGDYLAEYGLSISWDKKELGGVLKSLTRCQPAGAAIHGTAKAPEAKA